MRFNIDSESEGLFTELRVLSTFDSGTEIHALIPGKGKFLVYSSGEYPVGGIDSLTEEVVKDKIISLL